MRPGARRGTFLLLAVLALLVAAPAASAADGYRWSGTLSVVKTRTGPETSFRAAFTGPVTASDSGGFSWYQPAMTAYSDTHQGAGSWCRSTSDLVAPDPADEQVPLFVEWGRVRADGSTAVPRIIPGVLEWSFPRHSWQCLAFDGGELKRYEDHQPGIYSLDGAFACAAADYDPALVDGIPFATSSYLSPALPAPQVLADGTIRFAGSVSASCTEWEPGASGQLTMTVDLVGTPADALDQSVIGVSHDLQVVVHGTQYGSVVGADGTIACGQGGVACSTTVPRGSTVRLAALNAEAGLHHLWLGCDQAVAQSCLVTARGPRTVHAWFGYDFVGQWEPPPDGLFDPGRKAEIAGNGASSARSGAIGCGLTAALIGSAGSSSVLVVGTAGVATRWSALVEKAFEETVGECAKGVAGTIFNGLLLKVDPPDPQWRRVALAEAFPRKRVTAACPAKRGCAAFTRARRALVAAHARELELQEALAVASNRYGNAVTAGDRPAMALHQATMRATSGLLASATAARNRAARSLVRAIRATGVRKAVVPKRAVARALKARAAGRGIPRATVARLLRKRLIAHSREVAATLRSSTPKRAAGVDLLRELARPVATARMRAAARQLTLGDVARLLQAVLRDTRVPAAVAERHAERLAAALQCDAGSPAALRSLAAMAAGREGLRGEGGILVAAAAREVATHALARDEACQG